VVKVVEKVRRRTGPRKELRRDGQYHISRFDGPTDPWPRGGWSLYRISGDEIAQRIKFNEANTKVVRRNPWCGYISTFETLDEVMAAIEADRDEVITIVDYND
jgi:hypothetical protein